MGSQRQMKVEFDALTVAHQFDRAAKQYRRRATMQMDIARDLARVSWPHLNRLTSTNSDLDIVDLGCGSGQLQLACNEFGYGVDLIGCDISFGMLTEARKVRNSLDNPAVCVQSSIQELPFADFSFDAVISSSSLQWVDLERAMPKLRPLLRPSGLIAFSTFIEGTLQEWHQWWSGFVNHSFLSADEIQRILDTSGFSVVESKSETYQHEFDSLRSATKALSDLGVSGAANQHDCSLAVRSRAQQAHQKINSHLSGGGSLIHKYNVYTVIAQIDSSSSKVNSGEA